MDKNTKKLVKKGLLVGVGIAAFAQEKGDRFVQELTKKGELTRNEGKKLIRKIYGEAEKSKKKITSLIEAELKRLLKTAKQPKKKPAKKKKRKKKGKRKRR